MALDKGTPVRLVGPRGWPLAGQVGRIAAVRSGDPISPYEVELPALGATVAVHADEVERHTPPTPPPPPPRKRSS